MAREFSVVVGINATKAIAGGRQFKAGADQVNRSNRTMQRSTARTTKRMTAMITTMGRFRGVASVMFAGFLGVGGIGAVIRTLTQFSGALSKVEALLGPRALGGAMVALESRARSLGATTVFTATQAAEGMQFLTLAGFDALEVFQAIGPALNLAQAGALGLGQAADIVSNIMAGFGIEAAKTGDVVDALAFVASRTNTNIQQLGEAMKFVAPVAGAVGISVEETAAALGILGNAGLQASLAGTSLRRVFSGLLNPSKEASSVLSGMGLVASDLVAKIGLKGGLSEVIQTLAARGLGAAEAFTLFGQRGAPGILSLIRQKDKLAGMNVTMQDIKGTAETMAKVMTDNLGGDARLAISALQEGILQLGDAGLTEWLRETVQEFAGFIRGLTDIKINMLTATDAMKDGIQAGQRFKENIVLVKRALVILGTYLARNMIVSVALFAGQLLIATAHTAGFTRAIFALGVTSNVTRTALVRMRAALISTGVGAAVVLAGYLLSLVLVQDDLDSKNVELADSYDTLSTKIALAAFKMDDLTARQKENLQVDLITQIAAQEQKLIDLSKAANDASVSQLLLPAATARVTAAQKALNEVYGEGFDIQTIYAAAGSDNAKMLIEYRNAQAEVNDIIETYGTGILPDALDAIDIMNRKQEISRSQLEVITLLMKDKNLTQTEATALVLEHSDAQKQFNKEILEETGLNVKQLGMLDAIIKKYDTNKKGLERLNEEFNIAKTRLEAYIAAGEGASAEADTLRRVLKALGIEMDKITDKTLAKITKATEKWTDRIADLKVGITELEKAQNDTAREVRALSKEFLAGNISAEVFEAGIAAIRAALGETTAELEKACEKTDKLTDCMDENAKAMDALWDQAMRNIQDSFADAFRNIGSGFDDFADSILDAFKDLLANMAAQAAINNIFGGGGGFFNDFFGGVTGSFGGGGGGGAASGGGAGKAGDAAGDKIGQAVIESAAFKALAGAAIAFGQGFGAFFGIGQSAGLVSGTGAFGVGASSTSISAVGGSAASVGGAAAAGGALGAIAGAVVDAIVGSRGDPLRGAVFATMGGIIGSIWGPPGALIGGAIGALVDNLIGGAQKLESASLSLSFTAGTISAEMERVVSTQKALFGGRKMKTTTENVTDEFTALEDLFFGFVDSLVMAAAVLGGNAEGFLDDFSFGREIDIKGKNSEQISQLVTDFMNDMMGGAIDEFLRDVTGLEDHIRLVLATFASNLAPGITAGFDAASEELAQWIKDHPALNNLFDGAFSEVLASGTFATQISGASADEVETFVRALSALVSISTLLDADLVTLTADAIEDANKTAFQSYGDALGAYREVIAEYDGSLESLERLAEATSVITNLQAGLIAIYQQVGAEISNLFQGSAQAIRESLLSEEELFTLRKSQIDELVEQASLTTDPQELDRLSKEINRLGLDAFNLLDEHQKALLGPEFIEFFEGLDETFAGQIAEGIGNVVQDQADLDIEVANRMEEAAQAIIDASNATVEFYEAWAGTIDQRSELGG